MGGGKRIKEPELGKKGESKGECYRKGNKKRKKKKEEKRRSSERVKSEGLRLWGGSGGDGRRRGGGGREETHQKNWKDICLTPPPIKWKPRC